MNRMNGVSFLQQWVVFLSMMFGAASSFAQDQGSESWCRLGYRSDAFWFGVHGVLGDREAWPRLGLRDDGCVILGRQFAEQELVERRRCRNRYEEGRAQGQDPRRRSGPSDPHACFGAGFHSGEAQIAADVRARARSGVEGETSPQDACWLEYRTGYRHGVARRVEERRIGRFEQICYGAGYFDGHTFLGAL